MPVPKRVKPGESAKAKAANKQTETQQPKYKSPKKERETTPTKPVEGLRKPQVRILEVLDEGASLTRKEISEAAKVDNAALTGWLGSINEEIRLKNDKEYYMSLVSLEYVTESITDEDGKNVIRYTITPAGKAKIAGS